MSKMIWATILIGLSFIGSCGKDEPPTVKPPEPKKVTKDTETLPTSIIRYHPKTTEPTSGQRTESAPKQEEAKAPQPKPSEEKIDISSLRQKLANSDSDGKKKIIEDLINLRNKEVLPLLAELLKDADAEVREKAAGAINMLLRYFDEGNNMVSYLADAFITEHDPQVRGVLAITMGNIHHERALLTLFNACKSDPDGQVRSFAIWSLGNYDKDFINMYQPGIIDYFKGRLREFDPNAALTLAKWGEKEAGPFLVGQIDMYADDPYQGSLGSWALAKLNDKSLIPQIKKYMDPDDDRPINARYNAAAVLAFLGDDSGREFLKKALNDETVKERLHSLVTQALARLGDKEIIPELKKELRSNLPETRAMAIKSLVELKETAAIPDVMAVLKDGIPKIRLRAQQGLEQLTGQTFDFSPEASEEIRNAQIEKINKWWQENKGKFNAPK